MIYCSAFDATLCHCNGQPQGAVASREFARGLADTAHPLLVQIIPIRRCNIDCGYCNEYDKVSPAGADRRDAARASTSWPTLGTSVVAFSGGEPMLHPDLDDLIRAHPRARHDGRAHHQRLLPGRRSGSRR